MAVGISWAKQILCWQHFPIGGLSFEQGPVLLTSWAVAHCWLHTEATTPRSCLGGPAQPLSILTLVLWHISFLTVNCALRGCAPLCQASSCNFTGVVQLSVCLVTGKKKASFKLCNMPNCQWNRNGKSSCCGLVKNSLWKRDSNTVQCQWENFDSAKYC